MKPRESEPTTPREILEHYGLFIERLLSELEAHKNDANRAMLEAAALRGELETAKAAEDLRIDERMHETERADKAETEAAALREALEGLLNVAGSYSFAPPDRKVRKKAREALASGAGEKAAAVLKAAEIFADHGRPEDYERLLEAVAAWKGEE